MQGECGRSFCAEDAAQLYAGMVAPLSIGRRIVLESTPDVVGGLVRSHRDNSGRDGWRDEPFLPSAHGRFWIICKRQWGRTGAPVAAEVSGGAVAVFSSRQEAGEFFRHRGPEGKWWIRQLPSVVPQVVPARRFTAELEDLLGGYSRVALDPLPEVEDRAVVDLVTVSRMEFMELLVRRANTPASTGASVTFRDPLELNRSLAISDGG